MFPPFLLPRRDCDCVRSILFLLSIYEFTSETICTRSFLCCKDVFHSSISNKIISVIYFSWATFDGLWLCLKILLIYFRQRGRKEKEKERNINVWLPLMHLPLKTWPATQACALTGNRTINPLVYSPYSTHWVTPA